MLPLPTPLAPRGWGLLAAPLRRWGLPDGPAPVGGEVPAGTATGSVPWGCPGWGASSGGAAGHAAGPQCGPVARAWPASQTQPTLVTQRVPAEQREPPLQVQAPVVVLHPSESTPHGRQNPPARPQALRPMVLHWLPLRQQPVGQTFGSQAHTVVGSHWL